MTLGPFRSFTTLQRGTRAPATFASVSAFSYAFWVRLASPLVAGRIIRVGDPSDGASFAVDIRVATTAEEVFTQTNCFIITRRHRTATTIGTADRVASPTGTAVVSAWRHLIVSFPNGAHPQLYINGVLQTMTAPDTALPNGAPSITSTDEIAIGDPTTVNRVGFVGDISRVTLLPFAVSPTEAAIAYRHQSDPLRWIGRGSKDALAATNHSPVAVPVQDTATSGSPKTINPRPFAFDQDGNTVSIVAGSATASTGSVVISGGNLVYTPPASFVGTGLLGYSLRDTAGLTSVGRVDVAVTAVVQPPPSTRPKLPNTSTGNLNATPSTLASVYGGAAAGNHIILASGNYNNDFTFDRNFPNNQPVVIRSASTHGAVFTGQLFFNNGSGHFLHEVKTTFNGGSGETDAAVITGSQFTATRNWIDSRQGFLIRSFSDPGNTNSSYTRRDHIWIGYNRFTGQAGTTINEKSHIKIFKRNGGPGSSNPDAFTDIYIYRNYFSDGGPPPPSGESNYHIYLGNSKPTAGNNEIPRFTDFIIEENFVSANSVRQRFAYLKNGITGVYRNRSIGQQVPCAQRHGWGTQWWGNRVSTGVWEIGGGGEVGLFNDLRRNNGGTIKLGCGSSASGNNLHQATDYCRLYANTASLEIGTIAGNQDLDNTQGGKLNDAKIYAHIGSTTTFDANVEATTIIERPDNPLGIPNPPVITGVTDADGTVRSDWDGNFTGMETGNQD